jgi:hypothetical protein
MNKFSLLSILLFTSSMFFACKKETSKTEEVKTTTGIRTVISYDQLTPNTPYKSLFLDSLGDTVVDLTAGNTRLKMFMALNNYIGSAVKENKTLDSTLMQNMFSNTANPFYDIASLSIIGSELNASNLSLQSITGKYNASEQMTVHNRLNNLMGQMAVLSTFVNDSAYSGKPGKLGNYLADAKGIEVAQIIQKSLIGAAQYDYICNVLLNQGLQADNKTILPGKNYTQLEQNWDEAYGFLTLNPVYLANSTFDTKGTTESFLGSYIWEYNKEAFSKIYPAFLRGRAAIANNDLNEVKTQALFIRTEMEKALANSAAQYLNKWKLNLTESARIHATAEGLGFVYALRFCKVNGADEKFSDDNLDILLNSPNGYWDLTLTQINKVIGSIFGKFGL